MGYINSIFNNTRYIVFIQTKYHQNLIPEYDVSASSLAALLETIGSYRGGHFRSIKIYSEDITALRIYERNFINYKKNVLEKSDFWKDIYDKANSYKALNINKLLLLILDLFLYNFVFWKEVNKFGKTITNSKPKYLIDVSESALKLMYGKRMEYKKNKEGKEIIKHIDFHNGNLIINEEKLDIGEGSKTEYFLNILSQYLEKEYTNFISIFDYIELYEKRYSKDGKDFNYLNLKKNNIKNGYLTTINKKILEKYDREIFEIEKDYIQLIKKK